MANYIALIRKAADSDFSVDFPDFPGCVTAGKDLDEALAFAREALSGHTALMAEDGQDLPAPSSMESVMSDPDNDDAVAALIPVPARRSHAIRLNITLDEGLLARIDEVAGSYGRSRFLSEAARDKLGSR